MDVEYRNVYQQYFDLCKQNEWQGPEWKGRQTNLYVKNIFLNMLKSHCDFCVERHVEMQKCLVDQVPIVQSIIAIYLSGVDNFNSLKHTCKFAKCLMDIRQFMWRKGTIRRTLDDSQRNRMLFEVQDGAFHCEWDWDNELKMSYAEAHAQHYNFHTGQYEDRYERRLKKARRPRFVEHGNWEWREERRQRFAADERHDPGYGY